MIRLFYKVATLVVSVLLYPYFFFNSERKKNLSQRYGKWNLSASNCIWVHAASFGEITAIEPVIKLLKEKYPSNKILITCTTNTGLQKAAEIADYFFLAPFDSTIWIKRALHRVKFNTLIISETELWPNLIEYALKRDVPVYLINARISDYTLRSYKKIKSFLSPLLNCFSKIICINQESESRFRELGVHKELTEVAGYSKYDISASLESKHSKAQYFDTTLPLLTLGSIRPDEEKVWFPAIKKAKEQGLKFSLVVAPRHQEKFEYFRDKLAEYQLPFKKYSDGSLLGDTLLLDTMGKLKEFYTYSDAAFIGASLVNIGGHNPLEPVPSKCAVAIGPYHNNVRDVVSSLEKISGIVIIKNERDAFDLIEKIAGKSVAIKEQAERAYKFWQENVGASERIVKGISI